MKYLLLLLLPLTVQAKDMAIKVDTKYLFMQGEYKRCNFHVVASYHRDDLHTGPMKCKDGRQLYLTLTGEFIRNNAIPN